VAQVCTPLLKKVCSPGTPSHFAAAPVATTTSIDRRDEEKEKWDEGSEKEEVKVSLEQRVEVRREGKEEFEAHEHLLIGTRAALVRVLALK